MTNPTPQVDLEYVAEFDEAGPIALVRNRKTGMENLVEWVDGHWRCTCPQKSPCLHLAKVGNRIPLPMALRLAPASKTVPVARTNKAAKSPDDFEESRTEVRRRGAEIRAERMATLDRDRPVSSEVVVRQASPEDLERLRLARARKRRLRGENDPDEEHKKFNLTRAATA